MGVRCIGLPIHSRTRLRRRASWLRRARLARELTRELTRKLARAGSTTDSRSLYPGYRPFSLSAPSALPTETSQMLASLARSAWSVSCHSELLFSAICLSISSLLRNQSTTLVRSSETR
ncbi:MAG: hypothetical protein JXR37_00615 [Kiritimatiellae bacterium]|nr:hypothetical protein [Kiritimatiellia bacterium]